MLHLEVSPSQLVLLFSRSTSHQRHSSYSRESAAKQVHACMHASGTVGAWSQSLHTRRNLTRVMLGEPQWTALRPALQGFQNFGREQGSWWSSPQPPPSLRTDHVRSTCADACSHAMAWQAAPAVGAPPPSSSSQAWARPGTSLLCAPCPTHLLCRRAVSAERSLTASIGSESGSSGRSPAGRPCGGAGTADDHVVPTSLAPEGGNLPGQTRAACVRASCASLAPVWAGA